MAGYEVIGDEEKKALADIFEHGGGVLFRHGFDQVRKNSFQVKDFEREFAEYMHSPSALAVSSGTAALKVALASININPGDEVITQSFTFVATVEAILESGAVPICTEIDETLNMCPNDLISRITPRTKAVIVVHMLGTSAKMDRIKEICDEHELILIEDTAWGCGGEFQGKKLGTIGDIGCFSFDFAKTITTGEGGMLTFRNQEFHQAARAYHDHGHDNNPNFPRWEDTRTRSGFNYRMSEMQGAVGRAQLRKLPQILKMQRYNAEQTKKIISNFPQFAIRSQHRDSIGTDDAVIFHSLENYEAIEIRKTLLEFGISTKILPEATTWHFAGDWSHIFSIDSHSNLPIGLAYPSSRKLLKKCVSLPNGVFLRKDFHADLSRALEKITENDT